MNGYACIALVVPILVGGIAGVCVNGQAAWLEELKLCQQSGGHWSPGVNNVRIGQPDVHEHCEYVK